MWLIIVKNSIGKMYLQDIKTYHVQKFLNDLIDSGLAHGTVSNIRFMLSDMFDKAVLSEYIRKNPCIGVEMPKEVKKERRVLTREEQEKFFTFASSYIHINVLKFAVTTGCRIGEVLGLKWEDCDFEKREITINKTIHYSKASSPVEGSKFFYTTAKTMSSNRVIPMTDEVYEILQNQKIKQTEQKMWKRSIWKQHKEFQNLVFTCSDGSPVYYYNVNSAIKDYVAKINVIEIELAKEEKREPKIFELFTCHTLRHTYATRCYENGVDQQVVQKLLGHSTLAMTTDLYTHVSEEKKKAAIDRGILYTSGMIAGEGLVGILLAVFAVVELDLTKLLGGFSLGQIGAILIFLVVVIGSLFKVTLFSKENKN